MKRFLILLLLPATVFAEVITWDPPTTRQDGTPLDPMTELAEYRMTCGEKVTSIPPLTPSGERQTVNKTKVLPGYGSHSCYIQAVDTEGRESPSSKSVTLEWEKDIPSAPTNLLVIEGT